MTYIFSDMKKFKTGHIALLLTLLLAGSLSLFTGCITPSGGRTLDTVYKTPADADRAIAFIEGQPGPRDIETSLIYASLLLSKQRLDEAEVEYQAVISQEPKNPEALFGLGVIEHYRQQPDIRNRYLDQVLAINPKHTGANLLRGQILLDQDKYTQAEPYFMAVLKQNKDDVAGLAGLANVYMRTERMDAAIAFLDRAIALEPRNAYLYVDRSRALVVKRKYNQAVKDLTKAIELEPNVEWHYLDRARIILGHFEDPDRAYADLKKAESLNPDNLFTCYYLAEILDDKGQFSQANAYYLKVLGMRPDFYYIFEPIAKIALMKGDYSTAQEYFLRAYSDYEPQWGYIFLSYYCMVKTGRKADGDKLLQDMAKKEKPESSVMEVYRYYLGRSGSVIVADKVAKEQDSVLRNRLLFYIAMKDDLDGNETLALKTMASVAETKGTMESDLARWYLNGKK